jgi:hypothetical protein
MSRVSVEISATNQDLRHGSIPCSPDPVIWGKPDWHAEPIHPLEMEQYCSGRITRHSERATAPRPEWDQYRETRFRPSYKPLVSSPARG